MIIDAEKLTKEVNEKLPLGSIFGWLDVRHIVVRCAEYDPEFPPQPILISEYADKNGVIHEMHWTPHKLWVLLKHASRESS
jgi:hypothetical protein